MQNFKSTASFPFEPARLKKHQSPSKSFPRMSRSNDAGHFFQTSDALETEKRKAAKASNKYGKPVSLPSKVLALHGGPRDDGVVYAAEAAGSVRRVVLDVGESPQIDTCQRGQLTFPQTDEVQKVYTQGTAPLTCLAVCSKTSTLFAGSWDKNIHATKLGSNEPAKLLSGHTDFVKCLLATSLNRKPILISGGADALIIVWDVETGKQVHKLKSPSKSIQDLAIDPESLPEGSSEPGESLTLFVASNGREIRKYHISLDTAHELPESVEHPILAHETSIYKLCFDSEGDLWTASADKTAKHLVRSRGWEADTTLQHPDFVRDVVVAEEHGVVVTACRDEEVRVLDLASSKLVCTYSGHFEEVTGLVRSGSRVISASIDGTVRRWGLRKQDMEAYWEEMKRDAEGDAGGEAKKEGMLTAEEEAELAELMSDDDD